MASLKLFCILSFCFVGFIAADSVPANSLDDEELAELLSQYYDTAPVESKRTFGGYRRHLVPGKRGAGALPNLGVYRRPTLADYLKLAAIESELEGEASAEAGEPVADAEPLVEPEGHAVDKRRSRYGFWVTAINKMDNNHLKGFLGQHRNVYNVYKRFADQDTMSKKALHPFAPSKNTV